MIIVDHRAGSFDLLPLVPQPARHEQMEFGDVAFVGNGPDGMPVRVGIEVKKLNDALQCISTSRFAGHQLIGLVNSYNAAYLLIEGQWSRGRDGTMMERRGKDWHPITLGRRPFLFRDFEHWLTTVETAGVRIRRAGTRRQTADVIGDLFTWWTDKQYDEHRSLCQFDTSQDRTPMVKPGLVRRVAAQLPGISWVRSQHVAARFESVLELALADERDWMEIKWKSNSGENQGIGKGIARKVVQAIRGGTL